MPFFIIIPLWLLAVSLGMALLCFRLLRWAGGYLIAMSTLATIFSFAISTAGLFGGAFTAKAINAGEWGGLLTIAGYGFGLVGGAVLGAAVGFGIVLFFHLRSTRRRASYGSRTVETMGSE